jgi:2-oxoglutarate ferredoxin oxidoreductase subunit alpha
MDSHNDIFTVGIGGIAGDGIREAGTTLGLFLHSLGYEIYLSLDYPSLIRGGHNFVRLTFSKEKIWNDHTKLDVLIALNDETIKLHKSELQEGAVVFADGFESGDKEVLEEKAVIVPMSLSSKELGAIPITRSSVALGALFYILDLPLEDMTEILHGIFKEKKMEVNIDLAKVGYENMQKMQFRRVKTLVKSESKGELTDGNTAFSKGLMAAGLDFYIAYPMTPASSILHYLASKERFDGLKVIQPENEISAINMALGVAYAGKRVATGSATGGYALMEEAFSFAGISELPLVVAVSQRQAPATGAPTYSSQSDLRLVIHTGHGEFPRIVIAPGDPEESFRAGADALNLAWKFQIPVIVLLDKILSEHMMTSSINLDSVSVERGKIAGEVKEGYGRYEITPDGVSPMAFPGTSNAVVKLTSYEHDENGITADGAVAIKKMIDKRFSKMAGIVADMQNKETIKVYGDASSENAVVFFGSTKSAVLEAAKYLDKPVKLVQIIWVEPFPSEKVSEELGGVKNVIVVEANHNGQLASLIREKTGIQATQNILKYDSRPFDPMELAGQINKIIA